MRNQTIRVILKTLNETNERERIHSDKVSKISRHIGESMGLDHEMLNKIEMAGLVHDIGKITINEEYLNKPGWLTDEEYNQVKNTLKVDIKY